MQAVILAAGESSRFWPINTRHKSLMRIMGKPLMLHTVEGLQRAGIEDIIVVEGPDRSIEKELGQQKGLRYVVQPEPKGMGDAVMHAESLIEGQFLALNAERFDGGFFAKLLVEKSRQANSKMALLASKTDTPWIYGILTLEGDRAADLVEKPEKGKEPSDMKVVGIYLLPKDFFSYYRKVKEHMYAYEDALRLYMKENDVRVAITDKEPSSLKYPWDLFGNRDALMSGLKPGISKTAQVAKSAIIEGNVYIGDNTKVFENAVIKGPCYIGSNCIIGNNALVRGGTNLEDGVMIGANAELKNCIVQKGTHTHSGYLGDSIIGENCRIGTGFITANVRVDRGLVSSTVKGKKVETGLKSFGTVVGDNTKIGVGAKVMPGVFIGSNSIIGPATVVMENVDSSTKLYAKFENVSQKIE